MESIGTFLFYCIFFALISYLAKKGETKNRKKPIILAYTGLFLLTALRYDTGNDYANYYQGLDYVCTHVMDNLRSLQSLWSLDLYIRAQEPAYIVLAYIFHALPYPALFVIGFYSIVSVYFFYKAFDEYKVHSLALFLFFVTGFLFWYWDLIRQSAAVALFFFCLKYIRDGAPAKYVSFILLAGLFHFSALFLLPLYFFRYIKLSNWIYIGIILFFVMLMFAGFSFDNIFTAISELPIYGSYENDDRIGVHFEGFGYKLRLLCYALISILTIMKLPKRDNYLMGIITLGTVLLIVSQGNLLIDRITIYPFYVVIIGFAVVIKSSRNLYNPQDIYKVACLSLVAALFFLSGKSVLDGSDRGCSPYKTVFSDDFAKGKFKEKGY